MNPWFVPMVDFDLSLYAQGHLIKYRAFLDPFLEVGLGVMGKDYASDEMIRTPNNPIMATTVLPGRRGPRAQPGGPGDLHQGALPIPGGDCGRYVYY
ncbi:MAG: hypothetical protein MZV70_22100 [Desulfobacterales bacterium]|nr:hypothetical protein [Desulfobacterales bacterium]